MEEVPREMPNLFKLMVGKKEQKELLSQRSCLTQEKDRRKLLIHLRDQKFGSIYFERSISKNHITADGICY